MKNSIKREQSQACLSFAERENFRPQVKRKLLSILALLCLTVSGAWAQSYTNTVDINDGTVTVQEGEHWLITGTTTTNNIVIENGGTVTLKDVNISTSTSNSCITCKGNATIILADGSTNSLTNNSTGYSAIKAGASSTKLIIKGSGKLTATGGPTAAGIGSINSVACGDIEIQGGTITATGGANAAGIGAAKVYACGNITISGGTVTATGGSGAAGIGGGFGTNGTPSDGACRVITISGGIVTATGGKLAAGIGTGRNSDCGAITITEDVTVVTATKGNQADCSIGKGYSSTNTCGTVTIGGQSHGTTGIVDSPYTYPKIIDRGNCGASGHEDAVTWKLTEAAVLIVSGSGAMADYTFVSGTSTTAPWTNENEFIETKENEFIEKVVIEDGVTHIGDWAFGYSTIESVTIPNSVTTIGSSAFSVSCIESIDIPNSVTSIGEYAFGDCQLLETVTIGSGVTSIGEGAFSGCYELGTVTLNSNPFFEFNSGNPYALDAFDTDYYGTFPATITMNLAAKEGETGEYWMTFCNNRYNFEADVNTQVFKATLNDQTLTLTELTTDNIVNKDNAVILKSTANPIVMTLKTTDGNNDWSDNSLIGVTVSTGKSIESGYNFYVLNKGSQGVGFYKLASGKKVGVGKAYLKVSASNAREFFLFDDATGIEAIDNGQWTIDAVVYDLQGRRVDQPTKGLYIVNGKKVIIK